MPYVDRVLQEGESVRHIARLSWVTYLPGLFLWAIAGILAGILPAEQNFYHYVILFMAAVLFLVGAILLARAWFLRVTTEIAGNCGNGFAPATPGSRAFIQARMREFAFEGEVTWTDFASYLDAVAALRPSSNLGFMVGHNTLRYAAGVAGAATEEQVVELVATIATANWTNRINDGLQTPLS